MRLFLLSILAIGGVHSLTIGYPYRSALLGYNPARGEFPVQSSVVQGYLRYLDSSGVERLVGYSYPEPVYGVRQVSYVSGIPAVSSHVYRAYSQEESGEFMRAREAHFRAWSLQQYQALKREIDALRAEGKEPSADMMAKFLPLEKIALTSDYTAIAELSEIRRIRDEHLRIWNEARIQGLQLEAGQQPIGEIKTYAGQQNAPLVPAEETPEQKLARQEHLRIYNEHINHLRQLQGSSVTQQTAQAPMVVQPINRLAAQGDGITEVERATQEHLRLWDEAKLRAEQASYQQHGVIMQSGGKAYGAADNKPLISELKQDQTIKQPQQAVQESTEVQKARENHLRLVNEAKLKIQTASQANVGVPSQQPQVAQLRFSIPSIQQQVQQEQHQVVDTPEVVRAREEHLRLVNEARLRAQSVEQDELKHKHVVQVPLLKAAIQQPQQQVHQVQYSNLNTAIPQVADTAEVVKAREEHLRLVNEAKLKLQSVEHQQQTTFGHHQQANLKSVLPVQHQHYVQPQIADTPEVTKAREEHLRLVNEANLKVQAAELQTDALGHQVGFKAFSAIHNQANAQPQIADTAEVVKAREEHLRLVNEAKLKLQSVKHQQQTTFGHHQQANLKSVLPVQHQHYVQPQIADTPEVTKAREEHFRLVNEANLKLQAAELQTDALGQQVGFKAFSAIHNQANAQPQIADTAEVVKAREEHLRLVNEAKLKVHPVEHQEQQQPEIQPRFVETPEVIQARQEHLRIFNEIKSHAEKEQAKIAEIKASGLTLRSQENIEETEKVLEDERQKQEFRLLEIERLREAERLQEEQKQMELERMREAERLAEEQRQMELELIRLKLEEERRLEMEKSIEARNLKAEEAQMQQLIITEEYKPTQNKDLSSFLIQGPQQQQFISTPSMRSDASVSQAIQQQEQQYVNNPFLRAIAVESPANQQQQQIQAVQQEQQQQQYQLQKQQQDFLKSTQPIVYYPVSQPEQSSQSLLSGLRYIQSPQQSIGTKHQHLKDDSIKIQTADRAGYQPADTAAVLIHLEKARQEHFRAHEQALEQLRLARVNNPSSKDCN